MQPEIVKHHVGPDGTRYQGIIWWEDDGYKQVDRVVVEKLEVVFDGTDAELSEWLKTNQIS